MMLLATYFEQNSDALQETGILFDTSPDTANMVNQIWDDVPGSWNSADEQAARKGFCDRYGLADQFWWLKWAGMLWRV